MSIDTYTGLPVVPDGHFWRIKKGVGNCLRVQLRKRIWFGSSVVEWGVVSFSKASPEELSWTANWVLKELARKRSRGWKKYIGDYPPKKLEQEEGK